MTYREFYNQTLGENIAADQELPYPIRKVTFEKGQVITAYGEIQQQVYFLNSGIVEMTIKSYMIEKVIDFFFEGSMFTALTSFLTQKPSDVQIVAVTHCEAEAINRNDLYQSYETSLNANKMGRIILEGAYLKKAKREKDFLCKTAEELYAEMLHTHKAYVSNIPVNKIAKYLGIHPESLSRIRKKLSS
ncbi:Crp/Fnr family transcriptional regulator [Flavobacterium sp.]|uniref:Crp/Fnr family transcriptional regulator n=1 Tax=Flavobacterium sp. TaxID=239 RepID=UPI0039E54B49